MAQASGWTHTRQREAAFDLRMCALRNRCRSAEWRMFPVQATAIVVPAVAPSVCEKPMTKASRPRASAALPTKTRRKAMPNSAEAIRPPADAGRERLTGPGTRVAGVGSCRRIRVREDGTNE